MGIVTKDELIAGGVYVTRGGMVTLPDGEKVPWGYDRVRFVKIATFGTMEYIEVETPWNSVCHLPLDYPLESTDETRIREEFPLRGQHVARETIAFSEAMEKGICQPPPVRVRTVPTEEGEVAPEKQEMFDKVIEYFSTMRNLADAATHFNLKYQKMRYIVMQLLDKGYNSKKFKCKKGVAPDGKPGIQLQSTKDKS